MKRFAIALLLALAPLSAMAADAIVLTTDASQTLYVRIYPSSSTAVHNTLTAGSGNATRRYVVSNAALVTAGLSNDTSGSTIAYAYDVFYGTSSASADDVQWGSGVLYWKDGEAQAGPASSVELSDQDKEDIAASIGTELFQPRINLKPDPAFTFKASRRVDGTYVCVPDLRIVPGSVETLHPAIDMSPLFGPDNYVQLVGTPTISGGSLEVEEIGPRDTYAYIQVDGTATASETQTITVPITMTSGAVVKVKLNVKVFGE